MADTVTGYVERIIFRNEENGYTVLEIVSGEEEITLTGNFGKIAEGESVSCEGVFVNHPAYGEQFKVFTYEITEPRDLISIERYLGSGAIKGIGPAMAARIVRRFGEETLKILDEQPERLAEIKGISINGARQIAEQISEEREYRDAMMFLQGYGISLALAVKIYETYHDKVYDILKTNPYKLAEDINGIGFHIADDIARKAGLDSFGDFRTLSGINYALINAAGNGHVYLPKDVLKAEAEELLGQELTEFENNLMTLVVDKKIVIKETDNGQAIYAAPYYYMEENIAHGLLNLDGEFSADEKLIDETLHEMIEAGELEEDEEQKRAVVSAITHGVSIITGGPGTGKTTIINAIIRIFEAEGLKVELAAPTGRAAKRMTEATDRGARTIHRLLEYQGSSEDGRIVRFARGESYPLEGDVIIIDEMSMVDIFLMNSLVKAVAPGSHLILVGDANQLPSVGAGNVLKDIINSGAFCASNLTKIFRQDEAGDIIINAHKVLAGEDIDTKAKSNDFLFVERDNSGNVLGAVSTLVKTKLPDYVHADSFDIQVLTPMRKGALGVSNLNKILQETLNPPAKNKREKEFAFGILRDGDKVMQIKNNYDIEWTRRNETGFISETGTGVFNGELGKIISMNLFSEELTVLFDEGREVTYSFAGASDLELAYAVTVHKSQGSEYPAVVIPLISGPKQLMNKNLIYTAITRAKTCVCIVGRPETFLEMAANNEEQMRFSGLTDRIKEAIKFS